MHRFGERVRERGTDRSTLATMFVDASRANDDGVPLSLTLSPDAILAQRDAAFDGARERINDSRIGSEGT
jgi:hypothetical protein